MNSHPPVEKAFSSWLAQRCHQSGSSQLSKDRYSIAIEAPCSVCQPRIAFALAQYLKEFDESQNHSNWLPITDHQIEQLEAFDDFRRALDHSGNQDQKSAVHFLTQQGGVVLQLSECHAHTVQNPSVFQVSMSCHKPSEKSHHLWVNAKRIPEPTLIPMIANAFFDWSCNGGDNNGRPAKRNP